MNLKVNNTTFDKEKFHALVDLVNSSLVNGGIGYKVRRNSGGTVLDIRPGSGGGSSNHPFKVSMRNHPTAENRWQASVNLNSSLMKSLRPDDRQTITGLDDWFELIPNDVIWLGVIFFPGTTNITSASIDSYGLGDDFDISENAWSGENGYCEGDGTEENLHQASRVMIAYTLAGEDGSPTLYQTCYTHLLLRSVCIDGKAATFPMPAPYGPYYVP